MRADVWAREAVRMALVNLTAVAAPAGMLPVVLGAGWPGVLLHEAVGHGLEGDFNRRGTSVFSGHMGNWWPLSYVPLWMTAPWPTVAAPSPLTMKVRLGSITC